MAFMNGAIEILVYLCSIVKMCPSLAQNKPGQELPIEAQARKITLGNKFLSLN
jgi:hypothetical protein